VAEPIQVGDFHPISLINCSEKIITKVLVNKFFRILHQLIDDHQIGLIAVDLAQEIIRYTKREIKITMVTS